MTTDNLFCPPPKCFPVTIGSMTFCVQKYQLIGQRIFSEQNTVDGCVCITNHAQRATRLILQGTWVTDTDSTGLLLLLDDTLRQNAGFPVTLGRLCYPDCRIARYIAAEEGTSPLLTGRLELIATEPPQEVIDHA